MFKQLLEIIFKKPRVYVDKTHFQWSKKSLVYNLFRCYELVFGRIEGIKAEMCSGIGYDKNGNLKEYRIHYSWESVIVSIEQEVINFILNVYFKLIRLDFNLKDIFPYKLKISIPILLLPNDLGGIKIPASPFVFAIAFDAITRGYQGSNVTSYSVSHTVTGSNPAIFGCGFSGGNTGDVMTGMSYNSVSLSQLRKQGNTNTTSLQWLYIYGLVAPSTGSAYNLTATQSVSTDIELAAMSYSGVKQSGLPDAVSGVTAASSPITTTVTTVSDNCWAITCARGSGSGPMTASTNVTARGASWATFRAGDSNAAITPAGNFSQSWTGTGASMWACQVAFAPYVAPASSIKSVDGVVLASLKSFTGVVKASIKSITGVSNI